MNLPEKDFIVVDTEGNPDLREIAIIDRHGKLIYEAFAQENLTEVKTNIKVKPLEEIVKQFSEIAQGKTIVCHNVNHDLSIIRNSFKRVGIAYKWFPSYCTYEVAKILVANSPGFSLEFLSRHLNLKVNGRLFNRSQAHTASYDAIFTYQLYLKILEITKNQSMQQQFSQTTNPFNSSRVDNPFQNHVDFTEVYHAEFESLKAIIDDIKNDPNHQSKGAVVIGEAGTGKTHLMMRIANELLTTNRLLFIRQPNNAESVFYHIYARILESFAEKVEDKNNPSIKSTSTQLELLLASSFVKILGALEKQISSQKGKEIYEQLHNNALSLYSRLGLEGTQRHLESWKWIERNITQWWSNKYTEAGYSTSILKGIIKFCSYKDARKKELVRRWLAANELEPSDAESIGLDNFNEQMSREEFALEAIAVFGKLSTLDEPLIIIFDQLEGLGLPQNQVILARFGEAVKEILTHVPNALVILNLFPDRWEQFKNFFDGSIVDRISQHKILLKRPSSEKLRGILAAKAGKVGINLTDIFHQKELDDILSQKSVRSMLNRASDYFQYKVKNIPLPLTGISTPDQTSAPSLEDRVLELENIIKQISLLISPYISSNDAVGQNVIFPVNNETPTTALPQRLIKDKITTYLEEKKQEIWQEYDKPTILNDDGEIGKLVKIVEAFQIFYPLKMDVMRYGKSQLPDNLLIETAKQKHGIAILNATGNKFTTRIKNFNQLVVTSAEIKFKLIRDEREPQINPTTVGRAEIEKLNNSKNGEFCLMDRTERVNFELIHALVMDIQEKDLEIDLEIGIKAIINYLNQYWLINLLTEKG